MKRTNNPFVFTHEIKPGLSVIVDENRNQIIKRKNGRAKIFYFDNPPSLEEIEFTINLITLTEDAKILLN